MSKNTENSIFRSNQVARHKVTRISQGVWLLIENVYFHCIFNVSFKIIMHCRNKKQGFFSFEFAHVLKTKMWKINEKSILRTNLVPGHIVIRISQGAWFLLENVCFHGIFIVCFGILIRCQKKTVFF